MTSSFPLYPAKELDFLADFDLPPIWQADTGQPVLFISVPNPYLCPYADPRRHEDETPQGKQCLLKRRLVVISHFPWEWLVEARRHRRLSRRGVYGSACHVRSRSRDEANFQSPFSPLARSGCCICVVIMARSGAANPRIMTAGCSPLLASLALPFGESKYGCCDVGGGCQSDMELQVYKNTP